MAHRITLQPSGHIYEVPDGATVLNAGLEAGWNLPYSCRAGMCRTCQGRVVEGRIDYGDAHVAYLTQEMKAKGLALLCQARPQSDCVVEVRELSLQSVKPKIAPCLVKDIRKLSPDVAIVALRLPLNHALLFAAGQYVDILLADGKRRSYSIATPPTLDGVMDIELHVRHSPGGLFTDQVFGGMKARDRLRLEGPLGTFYLREESDKPIIFLASGTGFATDQGDHRIRAEARREAEDGALLGLPPKADLYLMDLPRSWAESGVAFVPVLSDALAEDRWDGRAGFVHRAVMADFPDLSGHQVYACGAPVMVGAARRISPRAAACRPTSFSPMNS